MSGTYANSVTVFLYNFEKRHNRFLSAIQDKKYMSVWKDCHEDKYIKDCQMHGNHSNGITLNTSRSHVRRHICRMCMLKR